MEMRPRIFIGSSQEAFNRDIPQKLQMKLSSWCDAQTWKFAFDMSDTSIESLEKNLPKFNAYAFILTPDDKCTSRGQTHAMARDNILFEIGLAMGLKGRENTFLIKQKSSEADTQIRLPSDLMATNYGEFSDIREVIDADMETISNMMKSRYYTNHADSASEIAEGLYNKKVKDLSEEIVEPIHKIRSTIEIIGKTLENEIAVLSGAQRCGIVNIFPNRYDKIAGGSFSDCIIKEFETSRTPICILGISLGDYFLDRGVMHKYFMHLIERQAQDGQPPENCLKIKALIVDPKCEALIERAYWEAGPEYCDNAKAYTDSTTYIETDGAARIAHRLQNKFCTLEVRRYRQAPTCFLMLTGKYAFVENYTYASRGSSCPSIQIEEGNELYKLYQKHFDNIWESADPIAEYDPLRPLDDFLFSSYQGRHPDADG